MKVSIQDIDALAAIPPDALFAYARAAGWKKLEPYGNHSEVYVRKDAPEIVIPKTQRLGDYANVVSQLIQIFAEVAETDELSLYRDLIAIDHDVVRVKAASESLGGSVSLKDGVDLIVGAYEMVFAAARSLCEPRSCYRQRTIPEVDELMRRIQLGHTEHGSFVATLMAPVSQPPAPQPLASSADDMPIARQMTQRLVEALTAAREATGRTSASGGDPFARTIERGVNANLCSAVAKLIKPFEEIEIGLTWARTQPTNSVKETVRFRASDAPILRKAAQSLRKNEPRRTVSIAGHIQRLNRNESEMNGKITLRTKLDERSVSVESDLNQREYERAVQAHKDDTPVVMTGDLQRIGNRWRLRNPNFEEAVSDNNEYRDLFVRNRLSTNLEMERE